MVGAQRRKARSVSPKKTKAPTYFRRKAKSASKVASASQKRIARAMRASAKIIKAARASTRKIAKTTRKKTSLATIRATQKTTSPLSKFFLSSDIAKERVPSVASIHKKAFERQVEVVQALNTGLKGRQTRSRLSRFEIMKRNLTILIRRLLSWFSTRSYSLNLTLSGRSALAQLEDLYDLLILEAMDDESLLRLKVAYGEACYYVTQASRGYQKKHSGRGRENYSPYFDRFVDSSGI